eukprot:TRINITY_DN240_c0_g2_i3.p1 TRINITY_DN240_c0_g2~~TRINITY_DN240_c0_g2_i3.p1  ORF type:complete len:154 (+),score=18.47 TRINITY_DN240_c0_g2_i3:529-990(+)
MSAMLCRPVTTRIKNCGRRKITQEGYYISVEVNDTQCDILSREVTPFEENVYENTTIPCYVDDDCNFDIRVPTVPVLGLILTVFSTALSCYCDFAFVKFIIMVHDTLSSCTICKKKEDKLQFGEQTENLLDKDVDLELGSLPPPIEHPGTVRL